MHQPTTGIGCWTNQPARELAEVVSSTTCHYHVWSTQLSRLRDSLQDTLVVPVRGLLVVH